MEENINIWAGHRFCVLCSGGGGIRWARVLISTELLLWDAGDRLGDCQTTVKIFLLDFPCPKLPESENNSVAG